MRQGLKDRIQFNPSNPSRMNLISTDYLQRNSFNNRVNNPFPCSTNGNCSNVQDASGFWIGTNQMNQQRQRQYYAPFRQPVKGYRKILDCKSGSPDISSCMLTTEIYKDNYANINNSSNFCCPNGSRSTTNIPMQPPQQQGQPQPLNPSRSTSGNVTRTNKPIIRSGMQPNIAGKQNSGLSNILTGTKYSYSYRELLNNRRKATQIKKLSTQKPNSPTYISNPQKMPGYGGNCPEVDACNPSETIYRYNNPNFAVQGAVEASDRITRLKLDTIRGATNCPLDTQTAPHTGNNCNGVYSVGNLQYASRTIQWPKSTSSYDQVKYASKFNNEHTEVNYPQVNALARVRGSSGNNRYKTGQIISNGSSTCPNNCPPQFLM